MAVATAGTALVALYVYGLGSAIDTSSYDVWAGYLVGPVLIAGTVPVLRWLGRRTREDPVIVRIMVASLVLKLAAALVRYVVAFDLYDGATDARSYVEIGTSVAAALRSGDLSPELGGTIPGTGFIELLTGLVFTVTGPTTMGGFLVYAWLGYWGLYGFHRAARLSLPPAKHRTYAVLVFLLPSLLFWPSSVGKDAWMLLGLGLTAWGASELLAGVHGGAIRLVAGVAATTLVRPHVSALALVALPVALVRRRSSGGASLVVRLLLTLVVATAGATLVLEQIEARFGIDDGLAQGGWLLDEAQRRTTTGGSGFTAERVRGLRDLPGAFVTVVLRPFPHEAHNGPALVASLEGLLLLALFLRALPGLPRLAPSLWREPYVLFSSLYTLGFVVLFSSFGNFGIIARQRVQLLPLLFVPLVMAGAARRSRDSGTDPPPDRPPRSTAPAPAPSRPAPPPPRSRVPAGNR